MHLHLNIAGVVCILIGIGALIYGARILASKRFYESEEARRTFKDTELSKTLFSSSTRYFIGRYLSGLQLVGGGLGLIALGVALQFMS
jgi:hypothetical protein